MFEKNMKLAYLFDFYQGLFDERTARIMRAYYEDDLSLAEIAEGVGISRQGVRHLIKKSEEQILFFEEKLSLAASSERLDAALSELSAIAAEAQSSEASEARALGKRFTEVTAALSDGTK